MKKLLALLLAALVLLCVPVFPVRAEGEEPEAAPAVESTAAPEADPTEPPAPAVTPAPAEPDPTEAPAPVEPDPTETPAPAEEPDPTETPATTEEPDPTETPAPAEPDPTETPVTTEEPDPTETPVTTEEPEPNETPAPEGEEEDPAEELPGEKAERSAAEPLPEKSLIRWRRERADLTLTGDLREDVLIIARSQLGYASDKTYYEEDESGRKRYYTRYGDWYGMKFGDWCSMFVSFCIYYGGNESYPVDGSCWRYMCDLKKNGYWREWNSYIPRKGDVVFFDFDRETSPLPTHVGLVEEVFPGENGEPGYLVTIEGNIPGGSSGTACVRRMTRSLSCVVGYGTYEQDKVYPEAVSVRSDGWQIIGPDSACFVEYPRAEVLRFLGMTETRYYAYWFPEGEPAEDPAPAPQTKTVPALSAKPRLPAKDLPAARDLNHQK